VIARRYGLAQAREGFFTRAEGILASCEDVLTRCEGRWPAAIRFLRPADDVSPAVEEVQASAIEFFAPAIGFSPRCEEFCTGDERFVSYERSLLTSTSDLALKRGRSPAGASDEGRPSVPWSVTRTPVDFVK
jgi:hypothetical protein